MLTYKTEDGLEFNCVNIKGGIKIVGYSGKKRKLEIPEKLNGKNVIAIGKDPQKGYATGFEHIKKLLIPETVTEIEHGAFSGMYSLDSIVFPSGMKKITEGMFYRCGFEEFRIPDGIEEICDSAFYGCDFLRIIYFPASVTKISDMFFAEKSSRNNSVFYTTPTVLLVVPEGSYSEKFLREYIEKNENKEYMRVVYESEVVPMTKEDKKAFNYLYFRFTKNNTLSIYDIANSKKITNIIIPDTYYGIPITELLWKDNNYKHIETLYIGENVLSIKGLNEWEKYIYSCYNWYEKKGIDVSENNPEYWSDGKALYTKDKKTLLHMFDYSADEYEVCSLTNTIKKFAFVGCKNLRKLVLPREMQKIENNAFYECGNLEEVVNLENVREKSDKLLKSIPYHKNCPFVIDGTRLLKYNAKDKKICEIPEGITVIESSAFGNKYTLENIEFPEKLYIPSSVKEINSVGADYEFIVDPQNSAYISIDGVLYTKDAKTIISVPRNYTKKEFIIPDTVETIGENAFRNNITIEKVVLPATVKKILYGAFEENINLKSINLENVEEIEEYAFCECEHLENINLVNVKRIGGSAFEGCKQLVTVNMENVKRIGSSAFEVCKQLVTVNMENAEEIEEFAFCECEHLENINLVNVKRIGKEAFEWCSQLVTVNMENAEEIEEYAFCECEHLENINIEKVKRIGKGAFEVCKQLVTVNMENVEEIGERAFWGCEHLENINIEKVKRIGEEAFKRCSQLGTVNIEKAEEIGDYAFDGCIKLITSKSVEYNRVYTYISDYGEKYCYMNTPDGVQIVGYSGYYCLKLPEMLDGKKVVSIGEFKDSDCRFCNSVLRLIIPETFEKIEDGMLSHIEELKSVVLPKSIKKITKEMFYGCKNLEEIYIPNSVEEICDNAFSKCDKLKLVFLPSSVTKISDSFFIGTGKGSKERVELLNDVVFVVDEGSYADKFLKAHQNSTESELPRIIYNRAMTEEDKEAFKNLKLNFKEDGTAHVSIIRTAGCENIRIPDTFNGVPITGLESKMYDDKIETLYLGKNVLYTGGTYINLSENVQKLEISEDNPHYWSDGKALYTKDKKVLLRMLYWTEEYEVCSLTKTIAESAFFYCRSLKKLVLPQSLEKIEKDAFAGCDALREIDGIENVKTLAEDLLNETLYYKEKPFVVSGTKLLKCNTKGEKICTIPEKITRIEKYAFNGSDGLEKIYLSSSVEKIDPDAFLVNGSTGYRSHEDVALGGLCEIEVDPQNNTYSSVDGVLYSKDRKTLIFVPTERIKTKYIVPDFVEVIGKGAFSGSETLKEVVLPDGIKEIASKAFCGCKKLNDIKLENIEKIGASAFYNCKALKRVRISGVEKIGNDAFRDSGITDLQLCDGLTQIGFYSFAECHFDSVVVPKTVRFVGESCFRGCKSITVYDSIDPGAKPCTEHIDRVDGKANSLVGHIGGSIWQWEDHNIIVRSAQTDEVKYEVWMGSDQKKYRCILGSSWGNNATFNFAAVDKFFSDIKGTYHKEKMALNRLLYPEMLSDETKDTYIAYLTRSAKRVISDCIDRKDMEMLKDIEQFVTVKEKVLDEMIDYASKAKALEFKAYLMDYKNKNYGDKVGEVKMPKLSARSRN